MIIAHNELAPATKPELVRRSKRIPLRQLQAMR